MDYLAKWLLNHNQSIEEEKKLRSKKQQLQEFKTTVTVQTKEAESSQQASLQKQE